MVFYHKFAFARINRDSAGNSEECDQMIGRRKDTDDAYIESSVAMEVSSDICNHLQQDERQAQANYPTGSSPLKRSSGSRISKQAVMQSIPLIVADDTSVYSTSPAYKEKISSAKTVPAIHYKSMQLVHSQLPDTREEPISLIHSPIPVTPAKTMQSVYSPLLDTSPDPIPVIPSPLLATSATTMQSVYSPLLDTSPDPIPLIRSPVLATSTKTMQSVYSPLLDTSPKQIPFIHSPVLATSAKAIQSVYSPLLDTSPEPIPLIHSPLLATSAEAIQSIYSPLLDISPEPIPLIHSPLLDTSAKKIRQSVFSPLLGTSPEPILLTPHSPLLDTSTLAVPLRISIKSSRVLDRGTSSIPASLDNENSLTSHPNILNQCDKDAAIQNIRDLLQCGWIDCEQQFSCMKDFVGHVNDHARIERPDVYKCQWVGCPRKGKGFNASEYGYISHRSGTKMYKMLIHIRTHTNEKPHQCSLCGKPFSRQENLKIHIRSHTGEKPYDCPYEGCNKAYSNSSDRFKHVRTHKEDKPYACKIPGCSKRYTDPSSLRKHVKSQIHHYIKQNSELSPNIPLSSTEADDNGVRTVADHPFFDSSENICFSD